MVYFRCFRELEMLHTR
ncbi:hypothetical protein Pint_21914 [Pistacia integerrima]|uniref:Uncharacterized protein n=1 Tax=Pistacia integerrima TaxID=434235 RepID=A0ACC0YL32_9ROSI|nr:hypothetical protein Pint_21914 [Pistacia integerrima]